MPSKLLKAAVITSSCLLVGGYLLFSGSSPLRTSSKRAHISPERWAQIQAEQEAERAAATQPTGEQEFQNATLMMSGSKSGPIFKPAGSNNHHQDAGNVIYGEGHVEFGPFPTTAPTTLPATQPTTRRTIMQGTKSGGSIFGR